MISLLFKTLFKIPFFAQRYYGFYKHIFLKYNLFKGKKVQSVYDGDIQMTLKLEDFIQQQIYFLGYYDKAGIQFLKNHIRPGSVFVDIGANIGAYTLIASKIIGDKGTVFAFEPVNRINNCLLENINLNHFTNVQVEKKALFEKNTTLKLNVSSDINLGMSSMYDHDEKSGVEELVTAIIGDEYFSDKKLSHIELIKIDIEGAELFALKGLKQTLLNFKPLLMVELNELVLQSAKISKDQIIDFLKDCNYHMKGIDMAGKIVEANAPNLNDSENFVFVNLLNPAHNNL